MRRLTLLSSLVALTPAFALAQGTTTPMAGGAMPGHDMHMADADKKIAGGLKVPGWTAHFDRAGTAPTAVAFVTMGSGYHVTAGPAAIYYDSTKTASGTYTVRGSFTQMKAPMHPEAYGLFVGGQNLSSDAASYLYFLVRGDGKYMIKHRADATTVHTIADWTASPAVHVADAAGKATNALRVQVGADSVRFYANDQMVKAIPAAAAMSVAGVAGFRVNHNLDVHVDNFAVSGGARAAR